MIYFSFINLFYIIGYLLLIINSKTVKNEDEFRETLSNGSNKIEINLKQIIDIKDHVYVFDTVKKISFTGSSPEKSILNFAISEGQIYFGENVSEIEFSNISINGNIFFDNNERITLVNSTMNGYIYSNFEKNSNEYVKITNFSYRTSNYPSYSCINLGGNLEIENSKFIGNSYCENRLLDYVGLDKYEISINNSYFSGEHGCPCLNIANSVNADIENSIFEKGYSKPYIAGGAAIGITYSSTYIKNCTFKDMLSHSSGGTFNLNNNYQFKAEYLNIYNTTSLSSGSMAYVQNDEKFTNVMKFNDIRQIDSGNMPGMINGGLIMLLGGSSKVEIENYYAENLLSPHASGSAFILVENTSLTVRNIEINKMIGNNIEGFLLNAYDANNVNFKAYNFTLNNLQQKYFRPSAALLWLESNSYAYLE
eukprot:jgi/Orpsp1_1/1182984/evm.model.c7180000083373.1